MKKVMIFITLFLLSCNTACKKNTEMKDKGGDNNMTEITGENVRLRKNPYSTGEIIRTVGSADNPIEILGCSFKIERIDKMVNLWLFIKTNNNTKGWIYGEYIKSYAEGTIDRSKIERILTDKEYNKIVPPFIKYLTGEFEYVFYNKHLNDKMFIKHNKEIIYTRCREFETSKKIYDKPVKGKLKIIDKKNRMPQLTIILENGVKKELTVYRVDSDTNAAGRLIIEGYLNKEEAKKYWIEFSKQ